MTNTWVYLNDQFIQENKISEIILDRGLFFGDGVFESMRVFKGKGIGLKYHIDRLFQGLEILQIEHTWNVEQIEKTILEIAKQTNCDDCYVRITVTRGKWMGSVPPMMSSKPNLIIVCKKFLPFKPELYEKGFRTLILTTRRNETSPLSQIKSLNYLDNILGRMQALEKGYDEGVFLNTRGLLTEGTASNLFLIQDNILLTPPLEDGVLGGVTRKIVLQSASSLGLKTQIRSLLPEEIVESDEGFLTNSSMGIVPWVQSDHNTIGKNNMGIWTRKIRELYEQMRENPDSLL